MVGLIGVEHDAKGPARLERHALGQPPSLAQVVQEAADPARVLAESRELALEAVDLLDHVDRDQNIVLLE